MSKSKEEQEPSMEEILSSIRRIIADEQDEDGKGGHDLAADLDDTLDLQDDGIGEDEDDVLDLGDDDVHDVTAGAFDDIEEDTLDLEDPVASIEEPEYIEDEEDAEDIFDPADLTADDVFPEPEDEDEADLEPIEMTEPVPAEPEPAHAMTHMDDEMETIEVASRATDTLISEPAASASTSAFARLARAAAGDGGRAIEGGDKSIEQFLSDLIKPMLKEWLDENLNTVVERVVEQEVKKLARRAELL
ncbi:MAG: DUF2497 domain-containing protein [Geminicoccaceae bacterium]|nr:DUF2497 domain-containing protein [Geminicoccaceae bacterium]